MIIKSDENFFSYTPNTVYICLIDKKCALSGETMKQCAFRMPDQIEQTKEKIKLKIPNIGSCYLNNITLFIVARESYHSKWNENTFETIWKNIVDKLIKKKKHYHINIEDYPWIEDIVTKYDREDLDLTLYHHCEW